jgi:hypothetical protein
VSRYTAQRPVNDDGSPIIGPDGRPIIIPHFQMPGFVVFDRVVDAQALGAYAFLCAFLDTSEGEVSSSVTAADIARRFGVTEQVVMRKGGRKNNPPGLIPRLAQAGALMLGPSRVKIRDCPGCGTEAALPCPPDCVETRGRKSIKPRFQLTQAPPLGFQHPGPMDRWEYSQPKGIARRLREEAPDSTTPPSERRQQMPFVQVLAWPALDPQMDLRHLGVYVFLAAHSDLSQARVTTGDWLFRETIADRFDLSVSRVSQITRELEEARYIAKHGLLHQAGHRHGVTGEPVSYAMQVVPPGGLFYPKALRLSEWRDPARITTRQEAVRRDPTVRLQFPHTHDDLRIVDNSDYPQKGVCGNERLWMCEQEAVDVGTGDLRTHPHTHPRTHPSPSAGAPQPQAGIPRGQDEGGLTRDAELPSGPSGDPLLALLKRTVPRALCRNGRQDQLKLFALIEHLRTLGYPDERLKLVFHEVTSSGVLNPWAVVYSRVRSTADLERHLGVLDAQGAKRRKNEPSSTAPPQCLEHGLQVVQELSRPGVPRCVECERRDRIEVPDERRVPTTDGTESPLVRDDIEELGPELAAESLEKARKNTPQRPRQRVLAASGSLSSPVNPGEPITDLTLVLDIQWSVPHCGRCNEPGRYKVENAQVNGVSQMIRVACYACHR